MYWELGTVIIKKVSVWSVGYLVGGWSCWGGRVGRISCFVKGRMFLKISIVSVHVVY